MPVENPLFVGSREFLYIYEFKYRQLFSDSDKNGGMVGRCYVDVDGNIGSIGSLCSIVERRRLEDGKGFFIIQANSRFKIKRILKREPYLLAEVILDYEDDVHNYVDENICERLCIDVYKLLKTYLRIARLQINEEEEEETIAISPLVRDSRPNLKSDSNGKFDNNERHRQFSQACANLLSTESELMQQLFQCKRYQSIIIFIIILILILIIILIVLSIVYMDLK